MILMCAAALATLTAAAQTVTESKVTDNIYVGVNGGFAAYTKAHGWMKNTVPNVGIRLGRNITPVFGMAIDVNTYLNSKYEVTSPATEGLAYYRKDRTASYINTMLLGTVNMSNLFGGYKGEPRLFEVIAVGGFGWGHGFKSKDYDAATATGVGASNEVTSKLGFDFAFNLGKLKAWQLYIEPAMQWGISGNGNTGYDINNSVAQLNIGCVYKFKNSNGTHNFAIAAMKDQSEIDALNAQINGLRGQVSDKDSQLAAKDTELGNKDQQIADLQKALDECNAKPAVVEKAATATNLQPTVLFGLGKSTIDAAQYAPIALIASYMKNHPEAKVEIKGYASPEGDPEANQKLSTARAEAVKTALVKKYKIAADRLTATGCGATDQLFEQVEFNRVATFNDMSK